MNYVVLSGARRVYIVSQLIYTTGAILIALTRHRVTVVLFSVCPGIMYATLFTMPYLLVAHYHSTQTVSTGSTLLHFVLTAAVLQDVVLKRNAT
jgi:hypothetical protein